MPEFRILYTATEYRNVRIEADDAEQARQIFWAEIGILDYEALDDVDEPPEEIISIDEL